MTQGTFRILRFWGVGVLAGMAAVANARQPEIIYTKIPGHPTSVVHGALDLAGKPVFTEWRALEDFAFSPDGSRWVIKGRTQLGPDLETILVSGEGAVGTMFAQEGQPIPGGAPGELFDFFGSGLGRWNSLGQFAYSARARGGIASVFQKVIVSDGTSSDIVFQMGDRIFGLVDQSPNPSGDETFGNSVGSVHILDSGVIGTQDSTIQGIHTSRRPAIMYDDDAFHQANVTMVTSLNGTGTETWKSISANTFYTTPDGAHWVAEGTVNQATTIDAVLVVDGRVRLQEGMLIPESTVTMNAIFANGVTPGGVWFARGDQPGANDWAVVNGTVVARTGGPVACGTEEAWGAVFAALAVNDAGDWVLAGNTDNPNPAANEVAVLNGQRVLLREGDQVDLDGDGNLDDAFIGRGNNTLSAFEPNDFFLTNDGRLYCFANLRNAAGQDLNSSPAFGAPQAFMVLPAAPAAINATVYVPWESAYCAGATALIVDITICNLEAAERSFTLSLGSVPTGGLCDGPSPTAFDILVPNPITVAAGTCIQVPVRVHRPPGLGPQHGCYQATITDIADICLTASGTGSVVGPGDYCCMTCCGLPLAMTVGVTDQVTFTIGNVSSVPIVFPYVLTVTPAGMGSGPTPIGLNGTLPGTMITGTLNIPADLSSDIPVDVLFTAADPRFFDIVLKTDLDADGTVEPDEILCTAGVYLRFGAACPCDWNGDASLNSQDFFDFLVDFFADNADFNNDNLTNSQDFFDFLQCFFVPPPGCD